MTIKIGKNVYIAPTAVILGEVEISDGVSIFDSAIIRGDMNHVRIGENSNIQDNATIHTDAGNPAVIGKNVSVGHNAIVHGATVDDDIIIGMGAIILNGAHIRSGCVVAAGAVVTENFETLENCLLAGVPAELKRTGEALHDYAIANAMSYQGLRDLYLSGKVERYTLKQEK
ncbi:MAG: gamma carbonic anhydrase family protein [Candidatus Thermoplasmatota archaeon]|nr:gamma carbonic anhydrase family protein [Candidatus Thermoplasmatota archaeon]MCL5668131.1 gamma carbonic anhydrase family protein [Candidatus Thermoplasmatota archaeon]